MHIDATHITASTSSTHHLDQALPRTVFKDNWLISFLDILLLFITMLSVLIVLKPAEKEKHPESFQSPIHLISSQNDKPLINFTAIKAPEPQGETVNPASTNEIPRDTKAVADLVKTEIAVKPDTSVELLPTFKNEQPAKIQKASLKIETSEPFEKNIIHKEIELTETTKKLEAEKPIKENNIEEINKEFNQAFKLETLKSMENLDVAQVNEGLILTLKDKVLFTTGSAQLMDTGKKIIENLSKITISFKGKISVEGHTDNIPISTKLFPSNWELSSARASMVARELIELGIPSERIRAIGYADTKPVDNNHSVEGRSNNRRVSILLHFDKTPNLQNFTTL